MPVSWNVHASRSVPTFAAEIREPTASLVLARSPFGYGHDPAGFVAPANVLVTGAGGAELHPATIPPATLTTLSMTEAIRPSLAVRCLIKTTF